MSKVCLKLNLKLKRFKVFLGKCAYLCYLIGSYVCLHVFLILIACFTFWIFMFGYGRMSPLSMQNLVVLVEMLDRMMCRLVLRMEYGGQHCQQLLAWLVHFVHHLLPLRFHVQVRLVHRLFCQRSYQLYAHQSPRLATISNCSPNQLCVNRRIALSFWIWPWNRLWLVVCLWLHLASLNLGLKWQRRGRRHQPLLRSFWTPIWTPNDRAFSQQHAQLHRLWDWLASKHVDAYRQMLRCRLRSSWKYQKNHAINSVIFENYKNESKKMSNTHFELCGKQLPKPMQIWKIAIWTAMQANSFILSTCMLNDSIVKTMKLLEEIISFYKKMLWCKRREINVICSHFWT